jgi:hypothetical protein
MTIPEYPGPRVAVTSAGTRWLRGATMAPSSISSREARRLIERLVGWEVPSVILHPVKGFPDGPLPAAT